MLSPIRFHHRERGRRHDSEPVVLSTPVGRHRWRLLSPPLDGAAFAEPLDLGQGQAPASVEQGKMKHIDLKCTSCQIEYEVTTWASRGVHKIGKSHLDPVRFGGRRHDRSPLQRTS